MYALAIIRYRRPLEEVINHTDAHRTYLGELKKEGLLLASGPFEPRTGGGLLLRVPDGDVDGALTRIRDNDPYVKAGVAQHELLVWNPGIGRETLDKL
ncbi:MAG TPA: YciI family protein [Candidatus Koribacter sp.]|jgi:uncharacterized protein YciI